MQHCLFGASLTIILPHIIKRDKRLMYSAVLIIGQVKTKSLHADIPHHYTVYPAKEAKHLVGRTIG